MYSTKKHCFTLLRDAFKMDDSQGTHFSEYGLGERLAGFTPFM